MEQMDYSLLYRWFVGLNTDDAMWDVSVFTKNRERLLKGNIAQVFFRLRCPREPKPRQSFNLTIFQGAAHALAIHLGKIERKLAPPFPRLPNL